MHGELFAQLKLRDGDQVKVSQDDGSAVLSAVRDDNLPANGVRVPTAHPATAQLGGMTVSITLERVEGQQKVAV
jgi:NADH-quinone oxidoreductase subunit G